jgi:hypothetical protein
VEEVEDGGELPHAAQPPPRQLGGRLRLHHERRHHAVLRRHVPRIPAPLRPRRRGHGRRGRGGRRRVRTVVTRAWKPRPPRGQRRWILPRSRPLGRRLLLILRRGSRRHRRRRLSGIAGSRVDQGSGSEQGSGSRGRRSPAHGERTA